MPIIRWHESGRDRLERNRLAREPKTERTPRPTGPGAMKYAFEGGDQRFKDSKIEEDEGGQFITHVTRSGVVVKTRVETRE